MFKFTLSFDYGIRHLAYNSIMGSGKNGSILHYEANNKKILQNEVILTDMGGEFHNYKADISRTFHSEGQFNKFQQTMYNVVKFLQAESIKIIRDGTETYTIENLLRDNIYRKFIEIGIVKNIPNLRLRV